MKKTILITGSTDGIGKLTAIRFAKEGHSLIIHGRNREKVASTLKEIQSLNPNTRLSGYTADFSDSERVKNLVNDIKRNHKKLDILINNAGIYINPYSMTKENIDIRFAVNYFAPYILTRGLIPLLQNGSNPVIINLSSSAQSTISWPLFEGQENSSAGNAYAQSKLAITMLSFYLAQELDDIRVIAVNPGSFLNTKMVKEAFGNHWSPAEKGVDILYELSLSEKHKMVTGKYYDNDRGGFGQAHPDANNEDEIQHLISKSRNLTGL